MAPHESHCAEKRLDGKLPPSLENNRAYGVCIDRHMEANKNNPDYKVFDAIQECSYLVD